VSERDPILLAYVACWAELDAGQIRGDLLTHVNYAFACIHEGRVVNFMVANYARLAEADSALAALGYAAACAKEDAGLGLARRLKATYPQLKVLISIGGWAAEGFSDAALTTESRERFADSALAFMHQHGFDGLDLDWEYPCSAIGGILARTEDRENFTALLRLLREKLDAASAAAGRDGHARYLLSIATGVIPDHLEGVDLQQVAPVLDFIGLMSYDLYNGWSTRSGHHANLFGSKSDPGGDSADKSVRLFRDAGVPASKLLLGAAFYGRGMTGVAGENDGLMQPSEKGSNFTRTYDEIRSALATASGWTRYWDEAAQAPYLYDAERRSFLSFEDADSLQSKGRYVRAKGLGGAMFWEYSNDRQAELLGVLHAALRR
jgi:chitinase